MNDAMIFNIQKFSIHDGPGIRTTVFFKGCPLRCSWCHNPESLQKKKDILFSSDKCTLCGKCVSVCPNHAIRIEEGKLITDVNKCDHCGECAVYCINLAREIAGKKYTLEEVVKEVLKDEVFYNKSNGGVTLSGGEPLWQIDFAEELLKRLKEKNIHTAVDTSGAVNFENIERAAKYTDLFLYDIKLMDDEKHKKYIGASNQLILANLKKLSEIHNNINIRMPIIEGINADVEHIEKVKELIANLNISKINLLPYHDIAKHKYKKLEMDYEDEKMSKPSDEKMNMLKDILEAKGFKVKIGG